MSRWLCLALLLWGCEGFGRAIVGQVPETTPPSTCEMGISCRPIRQAPDGLFTSPAFVYEVADCDGDGFEDHVDNCPGVPNFAQGLDVCATAIADCERLRNGETDLANADLRGCMIDASENAVITGNLNLNRALFRCGEVHLHQHNQSPNATINLSNATFTNATFSVHSDGQHAYDAALDGVQIAQSDLTLQGAAQVSIRHIGEVPPAIRYSTLRVQETETGNPIQDIEIARTTMLLARIIQEGTGSLRIEDSEQTSSRFYADRLEMRNVESRAPARSPGEEFDNEPTVIDARSYYAWAVTMDTAYIRAGLGNLSAQSSLRNTVFEGCGRLYLSDVELNESDLPNCAPIPGICAEGMLNATCWDYPFRAFNVTFLNSNIGGGIDMQEGCRFQGGVIGEGGEATLRTNDAQINGARFCDLAGAALYETELQCVSCESDAFMNGTTVCTTNVDLFENGCQALEFAAACP